MKKILVTLTLAILLVAGALSLLPQGSAQAQFEVTEATITVDDPVLPAQEYEIVGGGFQDGELVEFLINGTRLARVASEADGVTATVKIPTSLPGGTVTFTVRNAAGTTQASDTATLDPGLVVSAASGSAGSRLIVQGFAFAAAEPYTVTFTDEADELQATCVATTATVTESLGTGTTTRLGSFSKDTVVPDVEAGEYNIVAYGGTSGVCAVY